MKRFSRLFPTLLAAVLLTACATVPPPPTPTTVFADALFAQPSRPVEAAQVLALSEPMRRYAEVELAAAVRDKGPRMALADALLRRGALRLEYDTAVTRTAAQAFEARSGNCLSLVLMTTALARHLKLPVQFNHVFVDETWGRSGDLLVSSGHINVTVGNRLGERGQRIDLVDAVTIDFDPPDPGRRQLARTLRESTVIAMFMNNRAAESLAAGQVDDAYWWARAAIEADPSFLTAHNTLAVVYLRRGAPAQAELTLTQLLALEPENTAALSNLAKAHERQGHATEARAVRERLARIEPAPPFHYYLAGVDALKRRDYATARTLFEKEVARAAYYHEFHFGLALALLGLGEVEPARRQLAIAFDHSTRVQDRQLYAGKLERIKALRLQ
jgi:tetratricopeptide (TPR) repeat protein